MGRNQRIIVDAPLDVSFDISDTTPRAYLDTVDITYTGGSVANQLWRYGFLQEFMNGNTLAMVQSLVENPSLYFTKLGQQDIDLFTGNSSESGYAKVENAIDVQPAYPTNGLKLALFSDIGTTLDGSDGLSAWADQSGEGNDALQSTISNRPLYVDDFKNGLPALKFDGTNDFVEIDHDSSIDFDNTDPFTFIFFAEIPNDATGTLWSKEDSNKRGLRIQSVGSGGLDDIRLWFINDLGSNNYIRIRFNNCVGQLGTDGFQMFAFTYDGSSTAAGFKLYTTGTSSATSGLTEITDKNIVRDTLTGSTTNTDKVYLGAVQVSAQTLYFKNYLNETLVYNRVLTSTELDDLAEYYKIKYDLPYVV